jgi:hypothetical protein
MRLFKRNKAQVSSEASAQRIADTIINNQARLAKYLNGKVRYWSANSLRLWLIGFCLAFGGYCLYLIIGTFY